MGILREPAHYVEQLVRYLPEKFSVCELGDQWVTHGDPHVLSKKWFGSLGCGRYVSIDGNGRSGALVADLNKPLKGIKGLDPPFDLVTDFGTGEHVFDQAQVWRSIHGLVKPGGYIVFDRPSQGYPGHCYYLTDPGLYRDIANANGYKVLMLEHGKTTRGELIRGVLQRPKIAYSFRNPQQARYQRDLVFVPRDEVHP